MDDQLLLNASEAEIDREMALFRAMGIDRLRVSAFWNQIAPDAAVARQARRVRRRELVRSPLRVRAPRPRDRRSHQPRAQGDGHDLHPGADLGHRPDPQAQPAVEAEPGRVRRLQRRRWPAATRRSSTTTASPTSPTRANWLQPQTDRRGRPVRPHLYRAMVRAAYPRIKELDPDSVALVGELAASGREGRGADGEHAAAALPARDDLPRRALPPGARRAMQGLPAGSGRRHRPPPLPAAHSRPTHRSENRDDAAINDGRRLLRVIDRLTRLRALRRGRPAAPRTSSTRSSGTRPTRPIRSPGSPWPSSGASCSRRPTWSGAAPGSEA